MNDKLQSYIDARDLAERNLELVDYIDSTARRDREAAALRLRIKALDTRIETFRHDDLFGPINEVNP